MTNVHSLPKIEEILQKQEQYKMWVEQQEKLLRDLMR